VRHCTQKQVTIDFIRSVSNGSFTAAIKRLQFFCLTLLPFNCSKKDNVCKTPITDHPNAIAAERPKKGGKKKQQQNNTHTSWSPCYSSWSQAWRRISYWEKQPGSIPWTQTLKSAIGYEWQQGSHRPQLLRPRLKHTPPYLTAELTRDRSCKESAKRRDMCTERRNEMMWKRGSGEHHTREKSLKVCIGEQVGWVQQSNEEDKREANGVCRTFLPEIMALEDKIRKKILRTHHRILRSSLHMTCTETGNPIRQRTSWN
jgi:hypothetical protein